MFFTAVFSLCHGCASMSGGRDQYLVCSYDTVWDAAVTTLKERPVTVQNKQRGVLETGWIEMEATERPFGVFQRDAFANKERARLILTLKRDGDVTAVSLTENRERWHLRGGVTQQATRWWPVEPSQAELTSVMNRLNANLKERGCSPA